VSRQSHAGLFQRGQLAAAFIAAVVLQSFAGRVHPALPPAVFDFTRNAGLSPWLTWMPSKVGDGVELSLPRSVDQNHVDGVGPIYLVAHLPMRCFFVMVGTVFGTPKWVSQEIVRRPTAGFVCMELGDSEQAYRWLKLSKERFAETLGPMVEIVDRRIAVLSEQIPEVRRNALDSEVTAWPSRPFSAAKHPD